MDKQELLERLKDLDEILLLDLLGLTSKDLVDAFLDTIEEREEYIRGQID